MTKENAKELLPVIQAYAEGKKIQIKQSNDTWLDISVNDVDFCCEPSFYRIKPEEEYRPYKDCDEMIADFKERSNTTTMPLIWVKDKCTKDALLITGFDYDNRSFKSLGVYINSSWFSFDKLFESYTYLDNMPCGVKV